MQVLPRPSRAPLRALLVAGGVSLACVPAQFPGPGLSWEGSSGNNLRAFVPSCTNFPVAAVRGENVDLRVWGDQRSVFALFVATSGSQCLPFPGLGNGLVLDPPFVVLAVGTLTRITPCLACPPGFESVPFTLPRAIAPGTSLAFQAVGYGANRPSFTAALTATVR